MFCGKCGELLTDDAQFCTKCGSKTIRERQQTDMNRMLLSEAAPDIQTRSEEEMPARESQKKTGSFSFKMILFVLSLLCVVVITGILLFSGEDSSSPAIYVEGIPYRLTKDAGIQDIELIEDGLVVEENHRYLLYPLTDESATEIKERQSTKCVIENKSPSVVERIWIMEVLMKGWPFSSDIAFSEMSQDDYKRIGLIPARNNPSNAYIGVFTESGPVDLYSKEAERMILDQMRADSKYCDYSDASLQAIVEEMTPIFRADWVGSRMIRLEDTDYFYKLAVFESGTRVTLFAEQALMDSWINQWFPGQTFLKGAHYAVPPLE